VADLRGLSRLRVRRLALQGIPVRAITRAGTGDIELAFQYLRTGCHVGDIVICRSQGLAERIAGICGFAPVVIAFEEVEGATFPWRIVGGASRAVLVVGLEAEVAEGRGCSSAAIEGIDADEFVYLG
jgi:hypothetical protein